MTMWKKIIVVAFFVASVHVPLYARSNGTKKIVIFIHGSLGSGCAFFNPRQAWNDSFQDNAYYLRLMRHIRNHPSLEQDQALLGLGLHNIDADMLQRYHANMLLGAQTKRAAYYVIGSYDHCARFCQTHNDTDYYTYGHLGLLSQKYRKQAAYQLYWALCDELKRYKNDYETLEIEIVAHSHGGNIAFNVAAAEQEFKQGLHVQTLILWGTPIQHETAHYAFSDFFTHVINCYSDGDYIQGSDWISTHHRRSYKTFEQAGYTINASPVIQMRVIVDNDRRRIGHANMWLMGKAANVSVYLPTLPVVVLTPVLLHKIHSVNSAHVDCYVLSEGDRLCVALTPHNDKTILLSHADYAPCVRSLNERCASWNPDDHSRHPFFNRKLVHLLQSLWAA